MFPTPSLAGRLGAAVRLFAAPAALLAAAFGLAASASAQQNVLETPATLGVTAPAAATYVRTLGATADQAVYDVDVTAGGSTTWHVQLQATTTRAINQGDALVLTFEIGSRETAYDTFVTAEAVFERNGTPFTRSFTHGVVAQRSDFAATRTFSLPFIAAESYAAGAAKFSLRLAHKPQKLTIRGLKILNHGPSSALSQTNAFASATFSSLSGATSGDTFAAVNTTHPFFTQYYQVKTATPGTNKALYFNVPRNIAQNDMLVLLCYLADGDSSADDPANTNHPYVTAGIERANGPWNIGRADFILPAERRPAVNIDAPWRMLAIPFLAPASYDGGSTESGVGRARVFLKMGDDRPQTIRVAGVRLLNLGQGFTARQLTSTATYPGAAHDAPWRAVAASAIETHRKADLSLRVVGADGSPPASATLATAQRAHAFPFGSAADRFINRDDALGATYRARFAENFNRAVIEDDLKWTSWYYENNQTVAVNMLTRLRALGIWDIRGHTLVWGSNSHLPDPIDPLTGAPLRDAILAHIDDIITHPGVLGRLSEWDVLNEPDGHSTVQQRLVSTLGGTRAQWEASWFSRVRAATPAGAPLPRLFVNDYGLEGGVYNVAHRARTRAIIADIIAAGGEVQGVGFQSHHVWAPPAIDDFRAQIDSFAALPGAPAIAITEYDHDITDEQLQADFLRDYLTAAFGHPAVTSFTLWGMWDTESWRGNAALYDADWRLKPSGQTWRQLLFNQWWSNTTGATTTGLATRRVFKGAHRVTVTSGSLTRTFDTWLDRDRTAHLLFGPSGTTLNLAGIDLGNTPATGSSTVANGTYTLVGSGILSGRADGSHVATRLAPATGTLSVAVESLSDAAGGTTNLDQWAKAGLIVRQSLAPDAPYFAAITTRANGLYVQYRNLHGATTTSFPLAPSSVVPPVRIRIVRDGDNFYAQYRKTNNDAWAPANPAVIPVPMDDQAHGGLLVSSNKTNSTTDTARARAVFHTVQLP